MQEEEEDKADVQEEKDLEERTQLSAASRAFWADSTSQERALQ